MNNMPNPDAPACGCKWFERSAKDPNIPVVFDEIKNEYHLVHQNDSGISLFYHCPFCGGKAPESLRDNFFADVSVEETTRLHLLTENILTEEDMRAIHGEPDSVFPTSGSMTTPGSDTEAPETTIGGRWLIYTNLSETAEVRIRISRYGKLRFSFSGKYLGPKQKVEQTRPANPRPFGTSDMLPADSASRAGNTPEASGDS